MDSPPFRFRPGQPIVWYHRDPAASNWYCPYCATLVGPEAIAASNKEHLIGRNFVPSGYLGGDSFNFIFRSCEDCNARKSAAEGHVSSVSLFNSPGRSEDSEVDDQANRKAAKQLYPGGHGAVVKDSFVEQKLDFDWGPGLHMSFTGGAPPQLSEPAVLELAGMQIQALFSLVTTEDPRVKEKTRVLPRDQLIIVGYYTESDWGNAHLAELARRTLNWECPLLVTSARDYFRAVLKRSGLPEDSWFWALEWNRFVRIIGGIFAKGSAPSWLNDLPALDWQLLPDGSGRHRREIRLDPIDDQLFSCGGE